MARIRYTSPAPCMRCGGPREKGKKRLCDNCPPMTNAQITLRQHHRFVDRKLHKVARQRAKARGIAFEITRQDVVVPDKCPVLGIPLVRVEGRGRLDAAATLDRFDNKLGYVKGNVRVISWRANSLKSNATLAEIEAVAAYMRGEK